MGLIVFLKPFNATGGGTKRPGVTSLCVDFNVVPAVKQRQERCRLCKDGEDVVSSNGLDSDVGDVLRGDVECA